MSMHNAFQENQCEKIKIPDSGRISCSVKLRQQDSPIMRKYRYKIDTGADFSTISKDILHDLGFTDKWIDDNKKLSKGSTTVATGEEVESYYIEMPMISVHGVRGSNYPLNILMDKEEELPKPSCKGCEYTKPKKLDYRLLLGNDILSCFNIKIDRDDGWLYLERRKSLTARNEKYPDRQLNFIETE